MSDLYKQIDLLKQQASQTASETSGLPPGYVVGFALTLVDGRILVGPGTANVQGRAVSLPASRYINDDEWISKSKLASTIYYIYLRFTGDFFVDLVAPSFITGQYGNYHPELGFLYIGKAKTNTAGAISIVASHDAIIAEQADFDEVFIIAAKSPNYATGVEGWAINEDGSAEFNNATIRGTVTQKVSISETEVKVQGSEVEGSLRTTLKEDGVRVQEYDSGAWVTTGSLLQVPAALATSEIYYAFEDDVTDSGTAGDDGTAYGTPTYVAGQVGKAISLNGTDQYVTMPAAANRLYCGAGLDWTVGIWINCSTSPYTGEHFPIVTKINESTNALIFYMYIDRYPFSASALRISLCGTANVLGVPPPTGVYTHIAITWDGTTAKYFKNGTYQKDLSVGAEADDATAPIYIGSNKPVTKFFPGYQDELRIVPTSTVAGVLDMYQNGAPGSTVLAVDTVSATTSVSAPAITASTSLSTPAITSPNADLFACRAWVNFDGTSAANQAATYSRTGTTVTVTLAGHGHLAGHIVYCNFTSGGALDGIYTITGVPTADTFTLTTAASGTIAAGSTLELNRRTIRASGNVHSVSYLTTGRLVINFLTAFADEHYTPLVQNVPYNSGSSGLWRIQDVKTAVAMQFYTLNTSGSAADYVYVFAMFIR